MSPALIRVVAVAASASVILLDPAAFAQDAAKDTPLTPIAPPATMGPPPTPVVVASVRVEKLAPRKKVFGELQAAHRSVIAAEEGGIVREVVVHEGERAAAGAVLVRLDDARIKLALAANSASLIAAHATVDEREEMVKRSERGLDLMKRAAEQGGTNPREMSDSGSGLAIARAQLAQSRAAAVIVEQQGAMLAKRIADLEVRAPYAGVVTARHADIGAWIADGGAVVDFIATEEFEGWFEVPQEFLGAAMELVAQSNKQLSRGIPVQIQTSTGQDLQAVGIRVVPEIDPRSRTFHAVLRIMRDDEVVLASGLSLNAFVPQGAPANWTLVPKNAIVYQGVNASVYMVDKGVAIPVPVRIAFPVGDSVALEGASALVAGAQVVVEGNERLMPMAKVVPVAPSAPISAPAAPGAKQ